MRRQALPKKLKQQVIRRAGGLCERCCIDVLGLQSDIVLLANLKRQLVRLTTDAFYGRTTAVAQSIEELHEQIEKGEAYLGEKVKWSHAYEFDHVSPVAMGGSNKISNIRLLCLVCHRVETSKLAFTLAKRKRSEKRHAKGTI